MDIERLIIAKPSGNITAIIFDETAPQDMREVGAIVQREYPSVEQVLFVQKRGNSIHGQMAGGEFCGNAARSLGYILANGKECQTTFTMSGLSTPVMVDVKANWATLKMQTCLRPEQLTLGNAPVSVVHLEGISHAVLSPEHPLFAFLKEYAARPDRWSTVKHVLDDLDLIKYPASGLIFVENKGPAVHITPYVFVRDIETLYAETACASGSIAAASVLGKNLSLHQPSGEILTVTLKQIGNDVKTEVSGSMAIQFDGPARDLEAPKKPGTLTSRTDRNTKLARARAG